MRRALLLFGLAVSPAAPLAVSFAPGLLGPVASAGPLLRRLRAVGVTHLAAVPQSDADATVEQELLESGALDGIINLTPSGEPLVNVELGAALDRKEWVHICGDISDLAGAKRVGGRTVWLNLKAYADEQRTNSPSSLEDFEEARERGEDVLDDYMARSVIDGAAPPRSPSLSCSPSLALTLTLTRRARRRAVRRARAAGRHAARAADLRRGQRGRPWARGPDGRPESSRPRRSSPHRPARGGSTARRRPAAVACLHAAARY
eukprot:scaffold38380_cov58-Phaeocystis_antarctica.AAC.1